MSEHLPTIMLATFLLGYAVVRALEIAHKRRRRSRSDDDEPPARVGT